MVCSTSDDVVLLNLQPGVKYVLTSPALPASSAASPSAVTGTHSCGQKKNFLCDVCNFKGRDNHGLAKHKKSMHTLKVPALACKRYCAET